MRQSRCRKTRVERQQQVVASSKDPIDPHVHLLELRDQFPILETTVYLISNSLGAMPRAVETAMAGYVDAWRRRGVRAWSEGWWELPVDVGNLLAPLLGVAEGEISMHHNVTIALSLFLSCLDYPAERNRIVTSEMDFPSLLYRLDGEKRRGADIVRLPATSTAGLWTESEALLAAIDESVRLVVISHVQFRSSYRIDVEAIAQRCRESGALLVLDVYQSAGTMPLELERWGVDAAIGGCLKWLCGGPGNSFLWVRPELSEALEPALSGWQSHTDPFAFETTHCRVDRGAWRFLTGTPNVPAHCAARPGLEILGSVSLSEVRERSLALTKRVIERALAAGFEVRSPKSPEQRGGTVSVWHPEAEALSEALLARDVLCDYRPGVGIRLSPHFYNTSIECDSVIDHLCDLAPL